MSAPRYTGSMGWFMLTVLGGFAAGVVAMHAFLQFQPLAEIQSSMHIEGTIKSLDTARETLILEPSDALPELRSYSIELSFASSTFFRLAPVTDPRGVIVRYESGSIASSDLRPGAAIDTDLFAKAGLFFAARRIYLEQ